MRHQVGLAVIVLGFIVLAAPVTFAPPTAVQVGCNDLYGTPPAGVGDVAAALGLQVDGQVTGLFAGESLMGLLGPNGAGKTTLLGGHGFAAGDKVRITNTGGGALKIERLGGTPLTIQVGVLDYYLPEMVAETATALNLTPTDRMTGLFEGMSMAAVVGPSGAGKSTLITARGFSAGDKVKVTNAGGGKLTIERLGGVPLTIHIRMDEYFRPEGAAKLASALGLQIEGRATGLFVSQSLNAVVGTGSKMLFDRGYLKGNRVKVTNAGSGQFSIERLDGAPLTVHIKMGDSYLAQAVEELASALGLQIEGKATGLFAKEALTAVIGTGSKVLFDRGYLKGNRVKVTNAGGDKLTIERLGGTPLTSHIQMDEYWRPQGVQELASALGLQIGGKATGLFQGESLEATLAGGGSKILFDRGYLKGNRVKLTNAGGGKLTIERLGGAPLKLDVELNDFY